MSKFRMAVTCPECGELIISDDFMVDFTTSENDDSFPDGIPVVDLTLFACERFECKNCKTKVFTNDADDMYEYETEDEEDS